MSKSNRLMVFGTALFLSCCVVTLAQQPDVSTISMSCGWGEVVSSHELRGITAVRLDVDGLPAPVEGTDISEGTLAAQLRGQLLAAGLAVVAASGPDAPVLHVRVLPVRGNGQHFFVITAELEEPCRVARSGGIEMPFCTTWSVYPRLGVFVAGDAATLIGQVSDIGTQFIRAWSYDNASDKQ